MGMKMRMMNAAEKMPMPMNRSGVTADIMVSLESTPMSAPTKKGVIVPEKELSAPPNWSSWLPRLPPPPRRLSMGHTTVLSIQTQKPQMKAPSR